MKVRILLLLLISNLSFRTEANQSFTLSLLVPKENFQSEIINCVFDDFPDSSSVIMLRIQKSDKQNITSKVDDDYKLRITKLMTKDFAFFNLVSDKYFGYFTYKKHVVLVYGDKNIGYFFKKTKAERHFDFLSVKRYDDVNNPPIAIEPEVFVYDFINGKFTPSIAGRL